MNTIRDLFSTSRRIDRRIEKVIDYYADDEERLAAEVGEYEATENVEACFLKFLETYQAGVQAGQVTEVGMWVAGFYGSGKSSFTKYLGFALDPERTVHGRSFLDLLRERLQSSDVQALLTSVAKQFPTAVVLLDLGAEQLAESTAATVTNVLYWKVLQLAGYSKEKKLAQLEFTLDRRELYDDFQAAYRQAYDDEWTKIHNDPLIGVSRASRLLPTFLPGDFPDKDSFSKLRFEMAEDVRDLAQRMIDLVRRHTGCENILFMIDEAGQYVAPRGELILNLDGLARNLKELGQGKVWIVATGQQTLSEIVEKAALNSPELNKLRDRFPISIELDARDIREITYRRLLTKSSQGEAQLRALFQASGQALVTHTRLTGESSFKDDHGIEDFVRYYPFLPQHFEVLMELIRVLARSTGGVGLRSVIRVIQDVLVDTSRILPPDAPKLADRPVGRLACVDDFYVTLRADIGKLFPHVVSAVDQVERTFQHEGAPHSSDGSLHLRVARAVASLQPLDAFPRTAENIAALLYPELGTPSLLEDVRQALNDLMNAKEIGLIEDPQAGGYLFLSATVVPLQRKRREHRPTGGEVTRVRNRITKDLLKPQPTTKLGNVRDVRAAVQMGKHLLIGDREEISFRLEMVPGESWEQRRTALLTETAQQTEYQNVIVWLFQQDDVVEEILPEIRKSEKIAGDIDEHSAERDVAQYARAERRLATRNRERVEARLREKLLAGTFIFRGRATPVRQEAATLQAATRGILSQVAAEVFYQYHLVKIRPQTNLAARFLEVERLDRMPRERDPLRLVVQQGGAPRVDVNHPALAETLRAFKAWVDQAGGVHLAGKAVQDHFAAVPYGWSKDATRYLLAALLAAGEIELRTAGQTLKTPGPTAVEAFKSTMAFNKVGVGLRDSKVSLDVLDRAARRLQTLFGEQVLPLEDHVSRAALKHVSSFLEHAGALPDRLRLLRLPGEERAQELLDELGELLKGDASDAPSRLGAPDSHVPDDIHWAREATTVLDDGGEGDVRQARRLLDDLGEIGSLFPQQLAELAIQEQVEALQATLGSERFHEQLPDLRGKMRVVRERVRASYAQECASYLDAQREALTSLEVRADWVLLADADQQEIAARLDLTFPQTPTDESLLADYRGVLVRRDGLAGLQRDLEAQVERRKPLDTARPDEDEKLVEQAVQRLDEQETELAQARKLTYLGVMAGAMAHGLNQPIGIIRAISSASVSDFSSGLLDLQGARTKFEKILAQTDRLAGIIENMRAFAQGDWRQRERVELSQVVEQMCEMFADQFENRHINLECVIERAEPALMVWANPVQLQEVLINLLTNARDAVEGQPDASVHVRCWRMDDDYCAFAVQDNGPGLAPEYREQIFTPFVSTKSTEKGIGLGLFTSWRMIDSLGGHLSHEDRPGGGARFVVRLPPFAKSEAESQS